jgi:hypothetical protein
MRRAAVRTPTSLRRTRLRAPPRRRTSAWWLLGPYSFRDLLWARRRIPGDAHDGGDFLTSRVAPTTELLAVGRWMAALGTINPERCWFRSRRALAWGVARLALDPSFLAEWISHPEQSNPDDAVRTQLNLARWCAARCGHGAVLVMQGWADVPVLQRACAARLRIG